MVYRLLDAKRIGNAQVIIDLVPKGNWKTRPEYKLDPQEIAIHNTGNSSKGAGAKMHAEYLKNGASGRTAVWHITVDDLYIIQHLPFDETGWHTGDGSALTSGNRIAIGIEIAENPDMNYEIAEENAVKLVSLLREKFPYISVNHVKGHIEYSGKYCPHVILKRDGSMDNFRKRVSLLEKTIVEEIKYHIVKPDDTLYSIAKKFDISVEKLKALNKLESNVIIPSDKLIITDIHKEVLKAGSNIQGITEKIEKGHKVTLTKSAKRYVTGELIPERVKGREYTVQQVAEGRVLLEEIYSWVNLSDLYLTN